MKKENEEMAISKISAVFQGDLHTVWDVVTSLEN